MPFKTDLVVIGGYGSVGRIVCALLAEHFPGRVYAAGRNGKAARQFAEETKGTVKPLHWEVHSTARPYDLSRILLIVMCVDQEHPTLIRQCLEEGTHYVDITARADFLLEAGRLDISSPQAAALLSVGLAPGLSNLLAARAASALERTERIDISLMLGLGEHHGRAAIEWTIDQMGARFEAPVEGGRRKAASMSDGRTVDFGGKLGRKRVYRFPFSDQFTLPGTLGTEDISKRLGFDVNGLARAAAVLRYLGIFRLLRWRRLRRACVTGVSALPVGSEQFAVQVTAHGQQAGRRARACCTIRGVNQTDITAGTAAYAAKELVLHADRLGVLHLEQLLDADSVWSAIRPDSASDLEFDLYIEKSANKLD